MEKAIQSGKWFRIKKDGVNYWCKITFKFGLVKTHEIRIEKYFWFKKPFMGDYEAFGNLEFIKGGEFWYNTETAKELFNKAYRYICLNNAQSKRTKKERSKISHQNIIE